MHICPELANAPKAAPLTAARHEELDRQDEEGEQHHDPCEQQDDDLDEVFEEADVTHQTGDRVQDRTASVDSDLRDAPRGQEVGRRHARAGRLQAQTSKALEDDASEIVPVADQVSEHADEQRLLRQPSNDVLFGGPTPEYGRERNVDCGERCRQERDVATKQAEAGVDVTGKHLEEAVDNASPNHQRTLS
jgi:hypothetical protein